MKLVLIGLVAGATLGAGASNSAASIGYALGPTGTISRFDPYSSEPATDVVTQGWTNTASGFAIDEHGVGWGIAWSGELRRYDLASGTSGAAGFVPRPGGGGGFFKDLAWDAPHNRILAMHYNINVVTIGVLDTANHALISLGTVDGVAPVHMTGMAVSPGGVITIADDGNGIIWDLTEQPGGFAATRRLHPDMTGSIAGLEYDPVTGDLLTSNWVNRVFPDGSLQRLRSDIRGQDLAFVPIPGPGSAGALAVLMGSVTCRRRRRDANA